MRVQPLRSKGLVYSRGGGPGTSSAICYLLHKFGDRWNSDTYARWGIKPFGFGASHYSHVLKNSLFVLLERVTTRAYGGNLQILSDRTEPRKNSSIGNVHLYRRLETDNLIFVINLIFVQREYYLRDAVTPFVLSAKCFRLVGRHTLV